MQITALNYKDPATTTYSETIFANIIGMQAYFYVDLIITH